MTSPMTSPKYQEKFSPLSYQKGSDYNIDIEGSTTHQGRRVRRCNWIRFLTVYEGVINKVFHSSRNGDVHHDDCNTDSTLLIQSAISSKRCIKSLSRMDNNANNYSNGKLKPNMLCCLTESGQVVYEVIETLEPLTELIVQFKHRNIYMNNNVLKIVM